MRMIARKLKDISQAMDLYAFSGFLRKGARSFRVVIKANGQVEDIRSALMDYQVCSQKNLLLS